MRSHARQGHPWEHRTLGAQNLPKKLRKSRLVGIEQVYDGVVKMPPELQELACAIANLQVPVDAASVQAVLWLRERLEAKVCSVLHEFDVAGIWDGYGSLSLDAWLAHHGRLSRREARRQALTATRLAQLPVTAGAWADGTLSSAQVGAVVANVPAELVGRYAEAETGLTPYLAELSPREAVNAMRSWRMHAQVAAGEGDEQSEAPSELYLSRTLDGRRELSGHLGAEDAAVVEAAIASALEPFDAGSGMPSTPAERRANALADVCRWYLDNVGTTTSRGRGRPHVSVVVTLENAASGGPGALEDGTPVSGAVVQKLLCDAELHRVVMSGRSTILDYGSSLRTASPAMWAALVIRDGHCRHPGCDRPPPWCDAHHVVFASNGGPTSLGNMVMACKRHHHLWHDQGWHLHLDPDATLHLVSPSGFQFQSRPSTHNILLSPVAKAARGGAEVLPPLLEAGGVVDQVDEQLSLVPTL